MKAKEAKARIKINKLLEAAGWRFFDDENGPANIQLEANVKLTMKQIDEYGDNFEKVKNGFVDFLLLDEDGKPLIVLEAKSEDMDPLVGKEQARKYAKSQFVKYVIACDQNYTEEDLTFCERCGDLMLRDGELSICQNCIEVMARE